MAIDIDSVKSSINVFKDATDDDVNRAIDMATLQVNGDRITDANAREAATVYFARHLLYMQWFDGHGGVVRAEAFGNNNMMANPNVAEDGWLKQYNNIVQNYGLSITQGKAIFYGD